MQTFIPKTGALASPEAEKKTAWTLASVGAPTAYPTSAFLEHVEDMAVSMQSKIGCCVGCTFEEIVRYQVFLQTGKWIDLSWRFVYAMCKALEGTVYKNPDGTTSDYRIYPRTAGANDGTYPALAAIVVRKFGVPFATLCPNDVSLSADDFCYGRDLANIPQKAKDNALLHKAGADFAVPVTEDGIKQAITYAKANKGSVAILRRVGDTDWKGTDGANTWDKAALVPIRVPAEISSGHEEMLYGYDIDPANGRTRVFWLNSWSSAWCSTGGAGTDGGRAWEYLDVWLPLIGEIRVSVAVVPVVDTFSYAFTRQLKKGDKGADVVALQHVLKLEDCFDYPTFTGFFGDITVAGVKKLQEKYAAEILAPLGLKAGTGFVGNATLAWLKKHYSLGSTAEKALSTYPTIMPEYKSILSMLAFRFVRGFIAGAVSSMVMVNSAGVNTFADLQVFMGALLVSLLVGGIAGALLAVDKLVRSSSE